MVDWVFNKARNVADKPFIVIVRYVLIVWIKDEFINNARFLRYSENHALS